MTQIVTGCTKSDLLFNTLFPSSTAFYIPEEHISIDKELLLWKGKLLFKPHIPLKRTIFGIKMFCLCETTGYLWNSYVYLGKEPDAVATDMEMVRKLGKSAMLSQDSCKAFSVKATNSMLTIGTLVRNFFPVFIPFFTLPRFRTDHYKRSFIPAMSKYINS